MTERPCIFCGEPVDCDPGYPPEVHVVHPSCTLDAAIAECERRGLSVPEWMTALRVLSDAPKEEP